MDAVRRKETALDEKRVISIEEIRDRRKKAAEREMREEVSKEANMEEPNAKNRTNTENRMNTKIRTTGGGLHRQESRGNGCGLRGMRVCSQHDK